MTGCTRKRFSAGERALLRALAHHKAYGLRLLFDRAAGKPLAIDDDVRVIRKLTRALNRLQRTGHITVRRFATKTEYGLSAIGQEGLNKLQSQQLAARNKNGLSWSSLTPAVVAIAGCASIPQEPPRMPLMGYTTMTGLAQVRDPASGSTYYVPCNPCAAPTPKTPVTSRQVGPVQSPALAAPPAASMKPAVALLMPATAPGRNGGAAPYQAARPSSPAPAAIAPSPLSILSSPLQPAKFVPALGPAGKAAVMAAAASDALEPATMATKREADSASLPAAGPKLKLDTTFASAKRIVPFELSTSDLSQEHKQMMSAFIPFAMQAERVYIRGRTDATGDPKTNQALALARAVTVKKELLAGGVPKDKLKTTYCSTCYVASNATEEGRKANRRVEIELIMPANMVEQLPHALPISKATALATR